jgi:hypothetical protein
MPRRAVTGCGWPGAASGRFQIRLEPQYWQTMYPPVSGVIFAPHCGQCNATSFDSFPLAMFTILIKFSKSCFQINPSELGLQ